MTVVDRNWGAGDGWSSLGFERVQRMPPATFFVGPDGVRCHLMGGGRNPHRRQIPAELLDEFRSRLHGEQPPAEPGSVRLQASEVDALASFLGERQYFRVHDAGACRLLLLLTRLSADEVDAAGGTAEGASATSQVRRRSGEIRHRATRITITSRQHPAAALGSTGTEGNIPVPARASR